MAVAVSLPALPAGAALILNPSVETVAADGKGPASWEKGFWGDIKATFEWRKEGFDGDRSLRSVVTAGSEGDAKWSSAFAKLNGEKRLRVENRYRSDVATRILVNFTGPNDKTAYIEVAKSPASATWAIGGGLVDVPSWAQQLRVMHLLEKPGYLDTDAWTAKAAEPGELDMPPAGTKPKISISFDDGWISGYNLLISQMLERDLRGTHFIVSDYIDKEGFQGDYMTTARVITLMQAEHEIGSHSINHDDHSKLSPSALEASLSQSKVKLANLGTDVVGFAAPYGAYDDAALAGFKKHYQYARTVKAGVNVKPYKMHELWGVVVHDAMEMTEFADWVVKAAKVDGWVIFIYHRAAKVPPADSFVRPESFAAQMDYLIKAKADVRPIGEVLDLWKSKPVIIEEKDVVTGKYLHPPDAVGSAGNYEQPTRPVDACNVRRVGTRPSTGATGWLVLLALAMLAIRRRATALNPTP